MQKKLYSALSAFLLFGMLANPAYAYAVQPIDLVAQISALETLIDDLIVQVNSLTLTKKGRVTYAPGELLIKFKDNLTSEQEGNILKNWGLTVKSEIPQIKVKVLNVPEESEAALARALAKNPNIEFAEVNGIAELAMTVNDTYFASEWHLPKIGAPIAWDTSTGSGVTIAILDTGVDATHPDLAAKIIPGYNFYDNNTNTSDVYGHGTKSAGTAAAVTDNGVGVASVAMNSKIMPIRVAGTNGYATWSALANGTTYAADHGARVVSMSFQNPSSNSTVLTAANYARSKGTVVIGASGNTSAYDGTVASNLMTIVAATDSTDNRAGWSTYGPSVDIAAPGVSLYTTTNGGGYATWSGTSAATPAIAGVAALVIAKNSSLTASQIDNILYTTTLDLDTPGWDQYYGWGRVDAAAAVALAASTTGPTPDTLAPSTSITAPVTDTTVSGTIAVNANATDDTGVTKVELHKDGILFATDTTSPYSYTWNTTGTTNGVHTLETKAYDAAGNVGTSATITVTVSNVSDTTLPMVSVTSPVNGSKLPTKGNFTIAASASDNVGVTQIDLLLDGVLRTTCMNVTSCSTSVSVRKVSSGTHTITARAYDAAGNSATASVSVTK
jgi:subtilisin family serine protease